MSLPVPLSPEFIDTLVRLTVATFRAPDDEEGRAFIEAIARAASREVRRAVNAERLRILQDWAEPSRA